MPQLNTAHIFMIYFWAWFIMCLMIKKTDTILINKTPTKLPHQETKNSTAQMPWT
uniref:ATP synthase F0 subunit 8 n=1 Tax=Hydrophis ornatus TaxID=8685 RepID=UPI0021825036|nr:ATP synthase F0 subunit 8 [Hydrophis ornatus]BDB03940.1 ATPase subunit 8 [Hydrophis ornatus]